MGAEQSHSAAAAHHHLPDSKGNGILKECTIDPDPILGTDAWTLHHAQLHSSPTPMSVFISKEQSTALDHLAKNLRLYRHPNILRYINCTLCPRQGTHLFTEKVSPLSVVLKQQSRSQICLGLQKLAAALDFLHNVAKVTHDNVSMSSIFVTPEGNWKLAGMSRVMPKKLEDAFQKDVADFGALIETLVPGVDSSCHDDGSGQLLEMARLQMQSRDSKAQPSFRQVLACHFFTGSDLVHVENFLTDLPMKSAVERHKFFTDDLLERLHEIPANLLASQLAPLLLSRLVLLDASAVDHFLPHMLTPRKEEENQQRDSALIPPDLFREKIIPILINIFHVREMQIRLVLLKFFPNYVGMFSTPQLEDVILPLVLLGIRDSNDLLVSETLKALSVLVPILGAGAVIGKKRKKVFADGSPAKTKVASSTSSSTIKREDKEEPSQRISSSANTMMSREARGGTAGNKRIPPDNVRQSPIGAETSEEELHANEETGPVDFDADDWEPWDEEEDRHQSASPLPLVVSGVESTNLAMRDDGPPLQAQEASSSITKPSNNIEPEEPLDFFADMQPVIDRNHVIDVEEVMAQSKFSIKDDVQEDGWNDVDDEAWS